MAANQKGFNSLLNTIKELKKAAPLHSNNLKIHASDYGLNKEDVKYLIETIRHAGIAANIDLLNVGDDKLLEGLDLSDFINLPQKTNDWVEVAAAEVNSDIASPPRCTIL